MLDDFEDDFEKLESVGVKVRARGELDFVCPDETTLEDISKLVAEIDNELSFSCDREAYVDIFYSWPETTVKVGDGWGRTLPFADDVDDVPFDENTLYDYLYSFLLKDDEIIGKYRPLIEKAVKGGIVVEKSEVDDRYMEDIPLFTCSVEEGEALNDLIVFERDTDQFYFISIDIDSKDTNSNGEADVVFGGYWPTWPGKPKVGTYPARIGFKGIDGKPREDLWIETTIEVLPYEE